MLYCLTSARRNRRFYNDLHKFAKFARINKINMVFDEPNMSDSGLLISVEDLINQAMGPQEMNVINFKVLQMVLHILARQQRLLEQRVEIRISDIAPPRQKVKKEKIIEESETSIPKSPRSPKGRMTDIKEERESKKEKEQREKEKAEKLAQKAKEIEEKEKDRAERAALKEKQKAQKLTLKEQEKLEKLERKEKERAERQAQKEQEKAEKQSQKEQERAEKYSQKEKEKAERQVQKEQEKAEKMSQKEKEKAEKLSQKEQEKAEKLTQKEKEKAEKLSQKEQEKLEKQAQKEQEKADKLGQKEKEKAEKLSQKEKEKAEKLSQKEKEKAEKLAQKEREKMEKAALKEKEKAEKSPREKKKPVPSDTKEKRGKEKVLIETYSRGSIEVVTQSQFALLESAVKELKDLVAPPMPLKLPDNETLRSDLARGSASLQDTMRAMQVDARVLAAEQAITRMTGLLLAIAGAEPDDLDNLLDEVEQKRAAAEAEAAAALKSRPSSARKSVLIDPSAKLSEATGMARLMSRMSTASMRPSMSIMRKPSSSKTSSDAAPVTHDEMEDSINELREELIKAMNTMTNKATASADNALYTAKNVADKLDIALSLDSRISTLHSLATDYAEQLHGFDAGLATQMQSFREQMVQMRGDLKSGLTLLESVKNNAETAAVTELTERYQDLVTELDATLHAHRALTKFQTQLANELHSLVECVEMLREQKADRDEVVDGLRDKADTSRLAGLLTESEFATVRADLERRLAVCHDKFQRQDNVWMTAIKDLNKITDGKSEIIDLLSARDELQKELQVLHQRLQVLAAVLGEPNAAVVKRKLGVGAACAACGAPALMSPRDATRGAPPRLPALRAPPHQPDEEGEVCLKEWMPPDRPDDRHICHRWCGGSHTLVAGATRRERAPPPEPTAPTKRYTGYGTDGRLYMLEDELQPCIECNEMNAKVAADVPALDLGAGDQNPQ
ncbi:centrosomal protein of 131 kDa-like [Zerene cesonia]|uniref:centrosomal protein of 131 kDa-like n=1 Tax=Zerene cesonia TaxID=33412 RepID=UPI0018E58CAD|nr:centrosomal protein of 131 kDa-like [Zerene cesonia]